MKHLIFLLLLITLPLFATTSTIIKLDIKGVDKENIDVEANENAVTISGEYFKQVEEANPYRIYSFNGYGSFLKTMPLPEDADSEKMKTVDEGEFLIITIPKKRRGF